MGEGVVVSGTCAKHGPWTGPDCPVCRAESHGDKPPEDRRWLVRGVKSLSAFGNPAQAGLIVSGPLLPEDESVVVEEVSVTARRVGGELSEAVEAFLHAEYGDDYRNRVTLYEADAHAAALARALDHFRDSYGDG